MSSRVRLAYPEPRMNDSLEARAKMQDQSVVHETGGLILRDEASEGSV